MHGSTKQLSVLLFIFSLCVTVWARVEPYLSQPGKTTYRVNKPETLSTLKRFEENAPTLCSIFQILSEIILVLVWMVDASLNVVLWIISEAVTSCTELASCIFGVVFHVVKLLEAFGFGIKFLLEVNYTVVSCFFNAAASLKENFRYAITLVKISLANETEHVYESGSMALEGVQSLLLITYDQTWSLFRMAWGKVNFLISLVADNFKGCFGFSVPDISSIANMLLAAMKFFLESIVITVGVIADGIMFLSKYIVDVVTGLGTRFLINMLMISTTAFETVAMVMHYLIYVVIWPIHLMVTIVSRTVYLLYNFWEVFVNQACYLDELSRGVMWSAVHNVTQITQTLLSKTLTFAKIDVPSSIYEACVIAFVLSVLFLWRESVISHFRSALIILRRIFGVVQADIALDDVDMEDEELPVDELTEEEEYREPEMSTGIENSKGQRKLKYELERERDKRLCVICQDKIKNVLLLPCRHVCICQQCLQEIRHGHIQLAKCPLCRQGIQSTMTVFV